MTEESLTNETTVENGGPAPFYCGNCGREVGRCNGGFPGEKHYWCQDPAGHCKCPLCNHEHYEISHTHQF